MRKELKNKNKTKWIVGGVAFFGAVALLTTGFATWVVGVSNTKQDNSANITVDTTEMTIVGLEMTLSDSAIKLSENYQGNEGDVITNKDGEATDFDVTFSSITITASEKFLNDNVLTGISFQFSDKAGTATNGVNVGADDIFGRQEGQTTYVDIDEGSTIAIDESNFGAGENGLKKLEITGKTVTLLKWGTFFNNSTPCTFYNSKKGENFFGDVAHVTKVNDEMNQMKTDMTGKTLNVTASLVYAPNPVE